MTDLSLKIMRRVAQCHAPKKPFLMVENTSETVSGGLRFDLVCHHNMRSVKHPVYIPAVMRAALEQGKPNLALDNKLKL